MPSTAAERGQALPLSLACLFGLCLLLGFCFRSGERLLQRERVRMHADVTAFSGGISYARGLNILSISDKSVLAGWLATILSGGSAYGWVRKLQQAQSVMLKAGPWLVELSLLQVGHENGLWVLPVWNKPVLFQDLGTAKGGFSGFALKDLKPDFNLRAYGLIDGAADALKAGVDRLSPEAAKGRLTDEQAAQLAQGGFESIQRGIDSAERQGLAKALKRYTPNLDLDWLLKPDHYEYKRRSDGRTVEVGLEHGGEVYENDGHGGMRKRYKGDASEQHRYLKLVQFLNGELQLKLQEIGPHCITLLALQGPSDDPRQGRPGWVSAISQVQVAGGNFEITDPDSAGFGAFFMPVRLTDRLSFAHAGPSQHGFAADLPLAGGEDERMDADGLGALLKSLAPLAPRPLQGALHAADDLLAVQH